MERWIVKLDDERSKEQILSDYPESRVLPNLRYTLIVESDREDAKEKLASYPGVKRVLADSPETPDSPFLAYPDPAIRALPGLSGQKDFLIAPSQGEHTDIYVVDSGVRLDHEQFEGRASLLYSHDDEPYDPEDDHADHGTAVACCAAGKDYGIAKKARIFALRTKFHVSTTIECLDRILEHHREKSYKRNSVVNLSIASTGDNYDEEVESLHKEGVIIVASAGNEGNDTKRYPAAYPEVISVGATEDFHPDEDTQLTGFSCFGDWVDIHAPGERIEIATVEAVDDYRLGSGTSFSAPITAGLVACLIEGRIVRDTKTVSDLRSHLLKNAYKDQLELTEKQRQAKTPNKVINTAIEPLPGGKRDEVSKTVIDREIEKAHFLNKPTLVLKDDGKGVHQLVNIFSFASARQGVMIHVASGFETNLDSLPRIPGIHALLKNKGPWAAIIHDYLYRFAEFDDLTFSRKEADRLYREALVTEEVGWLSRWLLYLGVRATGWYHWSKYRDGEWSNTLEL